MPTTGTFRINPADATATGAWVGADDYTPNLGMTAFEGIHTPEDHKFVMNSTGFGQFQVEVNPDTSAIILDAGTVDELIVESGELPSGFTVTSLFVNNDSVPSLSDTAFWSHDGGIPHSWNDGNEVLPAPSLVATLFGNLVFGSGDYGDHSGSGSCFFGAMYLTGTYAIVSVTWWWDGEDYLNQDEDPGGDFVEVDGPTPVIASIVPDHGPTEGGTAVTITGAGFFPTLTVMFDGEFPGTDIDITNQHQMTCVSPAHWKDTVPVVITVTPPS